MFNTVQIFLTFWQAVSPTVAAAPSSGIKEIFDALGSVLTPFAAIGLLVGIVYFYWHSKNREELTKCFAEASGLAETRGKRISDLEKSEAEKKARIVELEAAIKEHDEFDEKRAKTEFRLRGDIDDLERQLLQCKCGAKEKKR